MDEYHDNGGIIRVHKNTDYFSASNEPFNDKRLSWETRGLMGYLLSKPDHWTIRVNDLLNQGPAGEYKIRRMLAEMMLYGYLNRIRITNPDHTFTWISEVFESPSLNPNPSPIFQIQASSRKSQSGASSRFSTCGKPRDILSTDLTSTEEGDEGDEGAAIIERYFAFEKLYKKNVSEKVVPLMRQIIRNTVIDYPDTAWYAAAFEIYVKNGATSFDYLLSILRNWKDNGFKKGKEKNGYNEKGNSESSPTGQERGVVDSYSPGDLAAADRINARANE